MINLPKLARWVHSVQQMVLLLNRNYETKHEASDLGSLNQDEHYSTLFTVLLEHQWRDNTKSTLVAAKSKAAFC